MGLALVLLKVITFGTDSSSSPFSTFDTQTVLLLITSSGFTAVVVSVITAIMNKKKIKAEEVNIISQAAGNIVDRLENENVRLRLDITSSDDRISDLELIESKRKIAMGTYEEQLILHRRYDDDLMKKLLDLGVTVEPPPLLILPR